MNMDMEDVRINEKGTIQNLLSLNYTDKNKVFEDFANVIHKNSNPEYNISFSLKEYRHYTMFIFEDNNSIGFQSLDELKRAYSIADSDRKGANNMGYGIFSAITIDRNNDAIHLFLQSNENGNYFSMARFDSANLSLQTIQNNYQNNMINNIDISSLINENGTRSIWLSGPNMNLSRVLKTIKDEYDKKDSNYCNIDDLDEIKRDIGKRYNHFIEHGIQIKYENDPIDPIDILKYDFNDIDIQNRLKSKYDIRIQYKDKSQLFYLREENEDSFKLFNKSSTNPFGKDFEGADTRSKKQMAELEIYHLGNKSLSSYKNDRKIWVEINDIKIFSEDFVMNQWANIRVILKLKNESDNKFDQFITPNANKSNSKINDKLKEYIVNLIKYVANKKFKDALGYKKKISLKDCWINHFGEPEQQQCSNCENMINPFNFHINDDKPVCKNCK